MGLYKDLKWADYKFICENCEKEFTISTNRDFEKYEEFGIDADTLDSWEDGFGAPLCLKCLGKIKGVIH